MEHGDAHQLVLDGGGAAATIPGFCHIGTIMHLVCAWLALLASPFWETKAPSEWTDAQIELLLHDSPWAEMAEPAPAVQVYLATARPLREAEAELARRRGKPLSEGGGEFVPAEGANKTAVA